MKKFLAIILALVITLGMCACGGGSGSGEEDKTADGKVKLTVGINSNALVLDHDNNALTKWIEEKCGVEIEFEEYSAGGEVATLISTTIAAREELPDILWGIDLVEATVSRYGKDGYFLDLSDYYADKEGASQIFWDRMENELDEQTQEYILRKITEPDGAIYGVPIVETSMIDKMQYQLFINTEWLDAVDMEKPTNTDELYEVLKAFKEKDPNGNGKQDEIPLFGSESGSSLCAHVVDWLINLHSYYNDNRPWNIEDGKVTASFTTDGYREGLKFVNKLYKEGLLAPIAWSASPNEMKTIITPTSGPAMVGIFAGHLTVHTQQDNETLYQYEPLANWGSAVRADPSCKLNTYITADCEESKRDKAFEVLMTMWSWDGSMRNRYGEYGVNWTEADEGAKSDLGLDATYKLISDPLTMQSTAKWATIASTLNVYAEGETAQIDGAVASEWIATKSKMHAESYALFLEAEENNNPEELCPYLVTTEEEKEATEMERTNVSDRFRKAQTEFCQGTKNADGVVMDPNDDAVWEAYVQELYDLGLQTYLDYLQVAYDRS